MMNVSEIQRQLELDENWNPIQDSFDQQGWGPPLDDRLIQEAEKAPMTFTWKNYPNVRVIK